MRGEQFLHGLSAERPFQDAMDVWIEFLGVEAHRLVQRQMQAEDRPLGVLEIVELGQERRRKLVAADGVLKSLADVERAGDELLGPDGAAILQRNAGGPAALDNDPVELDLSGETPARRDEGLE